jgi:nickel/cobalt exporter
MTLNLLVAIPAAVGLGALHFLEPGHGKGVMTAYLISSRARLRDAVLIGFTSALSHTFSILLLALVATSALQFVVPQQVEAWLGLLSGITITVIGTRMVLMRLFPPVVSLGGIRQREGTYVCSHGHLHHLHEPSCEHDHHGHGHAHHHHHDHHGHGHGDGTGTAVASTIRSRRRLLSIGILTGLIPCPSSLVMLLAAISAGQITYGIGMVAAFSLGGAFSLSLLGILLLKAENKVKLLERRRFSDMMATASSVLIVVLGFLVTYESFLKAGLL